MKVHVADKFFCDLCGAEMERLSTYRKDFIMVKDFNGWYAEDKDTIEFRDLCVDCKKKIATCMEAIRTSKDKKDPVHPEEEKLEFAEKMKNAIMREIHLIFGDLHEEKDEIRKFGCYDIYRPIKVDGNIDMIRALLKKLNEITPEKIARKNLAEDPLNTFDNDDDDDDDEELDDLDVYDVDDDDDEDDEDLDVYDDEDDDED